MNMFITYSVVDSRRTTDCGSLPQALALAHKLGLSVDAIRVRTEESPYVTFYSMDELIGDMMRNHAQLYRLIQWNDNGSGVHEAVIFDAASPDKIVHWLIGHMEAYELMGYRFDAASRYGSYHCCSGSAGEVSGVRVEEIKAPKSF